MPSIRNPVLLPDFMKVAVRDGRSLWQKGSELDRLESRDLKTLTVPRERTVAEILSSHETKGKCWTKARPSFQAGHSPRTEGRSWLWENEKPGSK